MPTSRATWGRHCSVNGGLTTVTFSNGTKVTVATAIAELIKRLGDETIARGYDLKSGQCGGYNCRAIGGTSSWSNHAWGLAVDLNWSTNPFKNPLTTDMPSWMVNLWTEYGFRWGGTYTRLKDSMHYEFMGTMDDAAVFTARAKAAGIGGGTPVQPVQPAQPGEATGEGGPRGVYEIQSTDNDGFIAVVCRCAGLTDARWKLKLRAARRVARVNGASIDNVWQPGDEVKFPKRIKGVRTYKVQPGDGLIAIAKGLGLGDDDAAQAKAAEINAWQGSTPQPGDIWFGGPA